MAPRVLKKGPDYTLDVKTRVPTGSIQKTPQPNLTPAPDTSLADGFTLLGGLARLGYSFKGFFDQNNQSNSVKGWDDMFPEVQGDYNFVPTTDPAKLEELNKQLLSKYSDHIQTTDYNSKVKAKMTEYLNDYAEKKMEQFWAKSISENEISNITNLNTQIDVLIKEEDINGALRLVDKAANGEDAWLNKTLAEAKKVDIISNGNYEIAKNDMLELDYATAYDIITTQTEDENGNLHYTNYPELTGFDREMLKKQITQEGQLEATRKSATETKALEDTLNGLYSDEISVSDVYKTDIPGLDMAGKIRAIETYEAQQAVEAARLDKIAAEPIWKQINNLQTTDPNTIRNLNIPNLTEATRKLMIDYLTTGVRTVDPYTEAQKTSKQLLQKYLAQSIAGGDALSILRAALDSTKYKQEGNEFVDFFATDYEILRGRVENNAALKKLTSIVSGAEKDTRFEDPETGIQNEAMFDQFTREYIDLFYDQIEEGDPEKQMNIDQFRQMADKLIGTITDEELQKEFDDVSKSNKNVGTGLLSSWNSNKMEDAVTSLNEGMYDAMKFIDEGAWSRFMRKMTAQYKEITGESYNKELRLYKDKIPVFQDAQGNEQMIIIDGNIPQLVSLDIGLDKHKNLALGYNVGDRNANNETMLSSGWLEIKYNRKNPVDNTVDLIGSAYGGSVIQPKGEEEFYIVFETSRGMDLRPFDGNPENKTEVAAAIKDAINPVIVDEKDTTIDDIIRGSFDRTAIPSFYAPVEPSADTKSKVFMEELLKVNF